MATPQSLTNQSNEYFNGFVEQHYEINNQWLKNVYKYSSTFLSSQNQSPNLDNEHAVSNEAAVVHDENENVSENDIFQLMDENTPIDTNFVSLKNTISHKVDNYKSIRPLFNNGSGILVFALKNFTSEMKDDCTGYIQLYNSTKFTPCSDRIWFTVQNTICKFSQTSNPFVFFEVSNTPELRALCVICTKNKAVTVPIAVSVIRIFENDGSFIRNLSFPNPFLKITDFLDDTIIRSLVSTECRDPVSMCMDIETSLVDSVDNFVFPYSNANSGNLISIMRPYNLLFRQPLYYISNFRLNLKSAPKEELINLKMYVLNDPDGEPLPVLVTSKSSSLERLFITLSIPSNKEVIFRDELQIFFDQPPSENTHIVVQISGKNEIIGTAVFKFPNKSGELRANVFETSQLPEGYLMKQKNKKINFTAIARVPENLVNVESLTSKLPNINLSDYSTDVLTDNFIPLVSYLLENMGFETGSKLVELINRFPQNMVLSCLNQWSNHFYQPPKNYEEIFPKLSIVFSKLIEDSMTSQKTIQSISVTLTFLTQCINVCLKTEGIINNVRLILPFLNTCTCVVAKAIKFGTNDFINSPSTKLNESIAEIFLTLLEKSDKNDFINVSSFHIQNLRKTKDQNEYNVFLIFKFYQIMLSSKDFCQFATQKVNVDLINNGYSAYLKLLSPLFYFISNSVESDAVNPSTANLILHILNIFVLNGESLDSESRTKIASALLPFLHITFSLFELPVIKKSKDNIDMIITIVLFLIAYTPHRALQVFFESLSTMRISFIKFLTNVMEIAKRNPNKVFGQDVSKRLLNFALIIQYDFKDLENSIVDLLKSTMYPKQSPNNYSLIFRVGQKVIEFQTQEQIKQILVQSVNFMASKNKYEIATGVALILSSFKNDFNRNNTVSISSSGFMEVLASKLFTCSAASIQSIVSVLDILKSVAQNSSIFGEKSSQVVERINASYVVAECVETQRDAQFPADVNALNLKRIADQYLEMPSMRVKWLRQIVINNRLAEDYASAFVAQMHVVALCAAAYASKTGHNIKDNKREVLTMKRTLKREYDDDLFLECDFDFIPGLELEFDPKNTNVHKDLLQDFTEDSVIAELEFAENLCRMANLYHPLSNIHSLLIRGHHSIRDYKSISEDLKSFSSDCQKLVNKSQNLAFFMLEQRADGKVKREVFCLPPKDYQRTAALIAGNGRLSKPPKLCCIHSQQCSAEDGCCLVPLFPVVKNNTGFYNEFVSEPQFLNQQNTIIRVKTANYMPYYKMSDDIVNFEMKIEELETLCEMKIDSDIKMLNEAIEETKRWIPAPEEYIRPHVERLPQVLQSIINEEKHSGEYLKTLYRFNQSKAHDLAAKLSPAMVSALAAFSEASLSMNTSNQSDNIAPMTFFAVNQFFGIFDVEYKPEKAKFAFVDTIDNELSFS